MYPIPRAVRIRSGWKNLLPVLNLQAADVHVDNCGVDSVRSAGIPKAVEELRFTEYGLPELVTNNSSRLNSIPVKADALVLSGHLTLV